MQALSLTEVCVKTALCRSYLYALIARCDFPAPAKCGKRSLFDAAEVDAWLAERFAERDSAKAAA